ncbi:ABC transporter permease [Micromonospora sp. CPCC 206060]|uniref:ABC transporter permease n=1 Tax=Micromonospora sp. CPCC 206060 TaxID=3122406 RepID=UPI002FF11233
MGYDEAERQRRGTPPESGRQTGRHTATEGRDQRTTAAVPDPGLVPAAVLDDVFDDPAHGEPGRDRIAVHLVWEILLLIATAVLAVGLYRERPALFRGLELRTLLVAMVALGLLTLAAGLSLRTAAPNLAVGPIAVASALHFAEQADRGLSEVVGWSSLVAAVGGLALAVVVVGLHVPAWAASLAAAAGVVVYIERRPGPVLLQSDYDPAGSALYLVAGFAAVAVLGGFFGTIKAVRRSVGRFRPVGDPARRRGLVAAVLTTLALVVSTVFAMFGGMLLAANGSGPVTPTPGFDLTLLAFGASLLGGTSAFGRRGGVTGTLLAVVLVTLAVRYAAERDWEVSRYLVAGAALAVGLLATRLVESFGRPRSAGERTARWTDGRASTDWSLPPAAPANTWTPVLPEQPAERRPDPWGIERWDTEPGRWDGPDR